MSVQVDHKRDEEIRLLAMEDAVQYAVFSMTIVRAFSIEAEQKRYQTWLMRYVEFSEKYLDAIAKVVGVERGKEY